MPREESQSSLLCDFLVQVTSDHENGAIRPLSQYLARFPGHEEEIAREYLAFVDAARSAPGDRLAAPERGADARFPSSSRPAGSDEGFLEGLSHPRRTIDRYSIDGEVGRGGMGAIHRVRDVDLDRELAMKVLQRRGAHSRRRFLEEARITGRLDHPGVVPVHEIGVDETGGVFFTMRLVHGVDFESVIERVHSGDKELTLPRALEVIIKVCDTMAFAHSRGIVHRDLKPSNVMVGRFGEAYVMDWGLARSLHGDELHDLRIRDADGREIDHDSKDVSPLLTLEGDVIGTPAYMSPEQAEGNGQRIGSRSDVYSVGAMLYHLLAGRRPYADGTRTSPRELLGRVRSAPPTPLRRVRGRIPRELAAICDKAMARDPERRYADMGAMAKDLHAFLDQRVVGAYAAGPLERTRKWIGRNRRLSAAAALLIVAVTVGTLVIRGQRAENSKRLAQLAGSKLIHDFDLMWPPSAASVPMLERWLEDARGYLRIQSEDAAQLEALRARAKPLDAGLPAERKAQAENRDLTRRRIYFLGWLANELSAIEAGKPHPPGQDSAWFRSTIEGNRQRLAEDVAWTVPHLTYNFDDRETQRRFDALKLGQEDVAPFQGSYEKSGLIQLAEWGLETSRDIEQKTLVEPRAAWDEAIASIADRKQCPQYAGLSIGPQLGLVPIGRDPDSGLWEFAHWASGRPAERDARGHLLFTAETGIVLVLIPGGTLVRGSQRHDPNSPNYDPEAPPEAPVQEPVVLEPFFASKFEMTQAQWLRVAGHNPSAFGPTSSLDDFFTHPVENVSYVECERVLRVLGLGMPTEAQWEYAARAGTGTPWSSGCDAESLLGTANFADRQAGMNLTAHPREYDAGVRFDDGFAATAPVGSFRPNAFGLHDVHGNVQEWCSDRGPFSYDSQVAVLTGERRGPGDGTRVLRGGSFATSAARARCAFRAQAGAELRDGDIGVRPSRAIEW